MTNLEQIDGKKAVKIRWNGDAPTLIRKEFGGEKFPVKKGGTLEVSAEVAKSVRSAYKEVEIVDDAKEIPAKKKMQVEGKLNTKKIAKN